MSRFVVANDLEEQVQSAFMRRPHLVDSAPGFISMEVLRGVDAPNEFVLITRWRDEASYLSWHRGHAYSDSHAGIPKGLKLKRGETWVRKFQRITK